MTIKRQWLIVLAVLAIVSVLVHAFFINVLTRNTFTSYLSDNYNTHVKEIESYAEQAMSSKTLSLEQMAMELETHVDEPITRIQLIDADGNLLIDVSEAYGDNRMRGKMGDRMMGMGRGDEDVKAIPLVKDGETLGEIRVTHYVSISQSIEAENFQQKMVVNTAWSVALVVLLALGVGYWIRRRMSRDLIQTAKFAEQLDVGESHDVPTSRVSEIRRIQQSLFSFRQKLRLKQQARKTLLDELVHQTRTPLTILSTRLEALEDGVITFSKAEAEVMQQQVDSLTALLADVNRLIDANGEAYALKVEKLEMDGFLGRIVAGMKPQFDRKGIAVDCQAGEGAIVSDAHLLSQVVYNVLMNAYKYTNEGGQVSVVGRLLDDGYEITIADSGVGIAAKDVPLVFDAYYRGQETATIAGDGLGLYVVKQNVERLKGSISLRSSIGQGTEIRIVVPTKLT
ncbi:MAG: hypothetical protein RLZZ267_1504 [Bacillota bacterium]